MNFENVSFILNEFCIFGFYFFFFKRLKDVRSVINNRIGDWKKIGRRDLYGVGRGEEGKRGY